MDEKVTKPLQELIEESFIAGALYMQLKTLDRVKHFAELSGFSKEDQLIIIRNLGLSEEINRADIPDLSIV